MVVTDISSEVFRGGLPSTIRIADDLVVITEREELAEVADMLGKAMTEVEHGQNGGHD